MPTAPARLRRALLVSAAAAVLLQAGCVMLPIPTTDRKVLVGEPVRDEQLVFLTVHVTTPEEVVERLGSPSAIWEDARVYAYDWVVREGVLLWAIGGGMRGAFGSEDIEQRHSLLVEFDEHRRLRRFERVVRPPLKPYGEFLIEWVREGGTTASSNAQVAAGDKAIVLLRVESTTSDGQAYEPFASALQEDNVHLGLGTFETGGEPRRGVIQHYLSPESRRAGWTCLALPHGTHYLAFYPPRRTDYASFERSIRNAPRWRVDVPAHARLVYVGTLRLAGESDALLLGGRILRSIRYADASVVDDRRTAARLLAERYADLGEPQVALMQRHEGPIILRSPLPAAAR